MMLLISRLRYNKLLQRGFPIAIAVGVLFRVFLAVRMISTPALLAPAADDYFKMGRTWLQTGHYRSPLFLPFYPLLCGTSWWIMGSQPRAAVLICLMQAGLSIVILWLTYELGKLLISEQGGLLAAALVAVEPALAHISSLALTETTYTACLLLTVYAACRLVLRPTRYAASSLWVAATALLLAVLTRATGVFALGGVLFLLVVAYRKSRPTSVGQPIVAMTVVILGLCLWMQDINHEYGHFALSCSGPYNLAALVIGPAKSRLEGQPPRASLEIWKNELGAELDDPDPFRKAQKAKSVAMAWAKQHPETVVIANLQGLLHLEAGPGRDFYYALLIGPRLAKQAVVAFLGAVCISYFLLFLFGVRVCVKYLPPKKLACIGAILFIVISSSLSPGAFGQARFVAPLIPLEGPLAAAGLGYLLRRGIRPNFSYGSLDAAECAIEANSSLETSEKGAYL